MRDLLQDIRYAARSLAKTPGFTAVVVLILAVGIGINTTIFTAVNAVLVRPLPYADSERLVDLGSRWRGEPELQVMSWDDLSDIRANVAAFEAVAFYQNISLNLAGGAEEPERIEGAQITANLFPTLGITPALGRTFTAEEEAIGGPRAAMLGDAPWRRRFHADPTVIGRSVSINGEPHTIVGVMPPRFAYPEGQQLWAPIRKEAWHERGNHSLVSIARLASGVTLEQAELELAGLMRRLEQQYPESNTNKSAGIDLLHRQERAEISVSLYAMMGAVAFVLLIACANVANLLLVRGAGRSREIAVRTALGAGRWRIVRQLLTESVLLAILGGGLGTLLAAWFTGLIVSIMPAEMPWYVRFSFDWRVAAFTAVIAMISGMMFGLAPSIQVSGHDLTESLKEGGQGAGTSGRRQRLRGALVVGEIALSVVLVAGAALMVRSFFALRSADPGFVREHLLTARVYLAGPSYDAVRRTVVLDGVRRRLAVAGGVTSVGAIVNLPLGGSSSMSAMEAEGRPAVLGQEHVMEIRAGTGDFLQALGVPLLRGRHISAAEMADTSRHPVVINETAARQLFPGEEALGKRIKYARDTNTLAWEVVGIARDVHARDIQTAPISQGWVAYHDFTSRSVTIAVRSAGDPLALVPAVRAAIRAEDASLPVFDIFTMADVVERSFWERKLFGQMFGVFGVLALALAALGLYSVISWSVTQRTREIGVRMALGAQLSDVTRLIVGGGMKLTLIGLVSGAATSLVVTGFLRSLLYSVQPRDPFVLAGTALLLGFVALIATIIPARRAARVDPMVALRND